MDDRTYMNMALALASKGRPLCAPNPMVGCVIVKNGKVIGQGYHECYGSLHAERNALASCTESPEGATAYVTLEPCSHYGKQPPCALALIDAKISRVVVASGDPNPLVNGKGLKMLTDASIEVQVGLMQKESDELNRIFLHYITAKTPYVVLKTAMSLDGKIACHNGQSKWITNEKSRSLVQQMRANLSAIMVGVNTVIVDNPSLTCRLEGSRNPIRIICDSNLRIPLDSDIVRTSKEVRTIIATVSSDEKKISCLENEGCEVLVCNERNNRVDLKDLMMRLGELKIDSILLEGGGTLAWEALNQGVVNHICSFIAPKIIGGVTSKTPVEGDGVDCPSEAFRLENTSVRQLDGDFLIEGDVTYVHGNS